MARALQPKFLLFSILLSFASQQATASVAFLRDKLAPQAETRKWDTPLAADNGPQAESTRDAVRVFRGIPQAELPREVPGDSPLSARNVPQAERAREVARASRYEPQAEHPVKRSKNPSKSLGRVPQAEKERDHIESFNDAPEAEELKASFATEINEPQAKRALHERALHDKRASDGCMWLCQEKLHACLGYCTAGDEECSFTCQARFSGMHCKRRCREGEFDR